MEVPGALFWWCGGGGAAISLLVVVVVVAAADEIVLGRGTKKRAGDGEFVGVWVLMQARELVADGSMDDVK